MTTTAQGPDVDLVQPAMLAPAREQPGCRLRWAATGSAMDGTWWPRTQDAPQELPPLLRLVNEHLSLVITRVSLHRDDWPGEQPRHLPVDGRDVRLGWFDGLPAGTVTVGHGDSPRLVLNVLAPEVSS